MKKQNGTNLNLNSKDLMDIDDISPNYKSQSVQSKNNSKLYLDNNDKINGFINNTVSKAQTNFTNNAATQNIDLDDADLLEIVDNFIFDTPKKGNMGNESNEQKDGLKVINEHFQVNSVNLKYGNNNQPLREKEITVSSCLEGNVYRISLQGQWSEVDIEKGIIYCS